MNTEIFSNHIGNASELTLLAKIKPGFVPIPQPLTYAARLRSHLRMLSALRRNGLESDRAGVYVGPLDSLRTLQYVRWTLVENDTKMLLAVNFDRAFEPYVRRIVDIAGPLLDTILCHCEGFTGHSSDQGFEGFMDYAMRHQVPVELFAASAPNVSVDDADYFVETDRGLRAQDFSGDKIANHAKLQIKTTTEKLEHAREESPLALLDQGLNILRIMQENADRFPADDFRGEASRDDLLYYNLTERLVPGLQDMATVYKSVDKNKKDWQKTFLTSLAAAQPPVNLPPAVKARRAARTLELLHHFQQPWNWFLQKPAPRPDNPREITPSADTIQRGLLPNADQIDGITATPQYVMATQACMLLLRVDNATDGAKFLQEMGQYLWKTDTETSDRFYNLSITHNGLKTLNVPEHIRLRFPSAFREGMSDRAGLLGDTDCNHPNEWNWPITNWPLNADPVVIAPSSVDIIIQIEASLAKESDGAPFTKDHPLLDDVTQIADLASAHSVTLLNVEPMQRRGGAGKVTGHLGFVDGISQPTYSQSQKTGSPKHWDQPLLGELLLGHQTRQDATETYPIYDAPLQNGTFQVIRKLKLDPDRFAQEADAATGTNAPADFAKTIQEKMLGRKMSGVNFETGTDENTFDYTNDKDGTNTPLQSHIRRANPRREDTPRILRRGFSYGPYAGRPEADQTADRGLFFIAYNANIAEQFEVIQRWISGGNSTGISSWHGDPLLAPKRPHGSRAFRFLHSDKSVHVDLTDKPFATLEWGLYAFTPSQSGLNAIAKGTYPCAKPVAQIHPDVSQKEKVKLLLEDSDDENREKREAFWAEIRTSKEPLDMGAFGVLVAKQDQIMRILTNTDDAFSVKGYRECMKDTIGIQYLGVDDIKTHTAEKVRLDSFLGALSNQQIFDDTFNAATDYIQSLPNEMQSLESDGRSGDAQVKPLGRRLESQAFIHKVTADLSVKWLGIPADSFDLGGEQGTGPHCPRDFLASSFYMFSPDPTDFNKQNAQTRTPIAVAALKAFIEPITRPAAPPDTLLGQIDQIAPPDKPDSFWTAQKKAEYIAGSCFGFVGPVTGSFRSVFYDWIKEDKLWRLQQQYRAFACNSHANAKTTMKTAVLKSMSVRPIADLLYRETTKPVTIGTTIVPAGRRVIFSQSSAIADGGDPEIFLFGGNYTAAGNGIHKCPGQKMGLYILMGCFAALFSNGELRPDGPLSLRIRDAP